MESEASAPRVHFSESTGERPLTYLDKIFSSNATLLALLPAFAYYLSYRFQVGYAGVFGIPIDLIEVELTNVLVVVALLLASFLPLYHLSQIILSVVAQSDRPLVKALWPSAITWVVILLPMIVGYGFKWRFIKLFVYAGIANTIIYLIIGYSELRKKTTSKEKAGGDPCKHSKDYSLFDQVWPSTSASWLILAMLIMSFLISRPLGVYEATEKREFMIVVGPPQELCCANMVTR